MTPISIQLYSLREAAAKDLPNVLRSVAEIGYVGVEFAGLYGHDPKEIAKLLDDLGLRVSANHTALPTLESEAKIVETELILGNSWVITGFGPNDFPTAEACKAASAKLNLASELLRPHGIRLAYHNHWWEFAMVNGERAYDILMECAPNVAAEIDIYWTAIGGYDPADVIHQYSARTRFLHVKDGPLVKDQPHRPVGAGKMDIPKAIHAADPNELLWLVVELDECGGDVMTAIRESYDYLVGSGLARGNK